MLATHPSPHFGALARPSTLKMLQPGNVPQFLTIPLFSPYTHIWVYQGAWERVNFIVWVVNIYVSRLLKLYYLISDYLCQQS
jgi:hypothetical protein